jgi:hypothetical protein
MHAEKRSLAPSVVGGVIGAAVGVGLHVALESGMFGTRIEAAWFAIVIGVLTGLGVRMACRGCMDRSYARGAIAGIIALAAIVGSSFAIREVMKRTESTAKGPVAAATDANAETAATDEAAGDEDAADEAEPAADAQPVANERTAPPRGQIGMGAAKGGLADPNPWEFVFMALGGLVAYELGRGADPAKRAVPVEGESREPVVGGTDPSN